MLKVGLTGGVASGKSTLAGLLSGLGAAVCDADLVVAELYRPGRPGALAVGELFGHGALTPDGGVDRDALARLVLADPEARRKLEEAVHPLVRRAVEGWHAALAHSSKLPAVAVVEAALLVETGAYRDQDRLVVVTAPFEARRAWALAAGWSASRFAQVVAAQLDDTARKAVADYVIRNAGALEVLEQAARDLWSLLQEDAHLLAAGKPLPARKRKGKRVEGRG
ncbi:MAG TPA: dephospho-CoA kinase [Thermoanaerobaculaceae bacterium]|nr:dephospho-CoA kinase [Thermoanaerobaculaceae bacterium]